MWIKICGIKDVETARWLSDLRPDAIGLNFFPKSRRHVSLDMARQITKVIPDEIETVGLFVNADPSDIETTVKECRLSAIQIHGDESEETLAEIQMRCPDIVVIRAFRCPDDGLFEVVNYLEICRNLGVHVDRCLLDASVAGEFGGTGHTAPWDAIIREYDDPDSPPLILAGGLHPGNVGEAISQVQPWGVDVASGVESQDGNKNRDLVSRFLEAARNR